MDSKLVEIEGRLERSETRLWRLKIWVVILAAGVAAALLAVFIPGMRDFLVLLVLFLLTAAILLGVLSFIEAIVWSLGALSCALPRRRRDA